MHANFGKRLAIGKLEIARGEVTLFRRDGGERRLLCLCRRYRATDKHGDCQHRFPSCEHSADSPCDVYVIRSYTLGTTEMQPIEKGLAMP
jgi:hypothetical protein